jgi:hypothetical protein
LLLIEFSYVPRISLEDTKNLVSDIVEWTKRYMANAEGFSQHPDHSTDRHTFSAGVCNSQ